MKTLHTHLPNIAKLALLCLSILLIPIHSHATKASFNWTPNTLETITGYKLYYKTGSATGEYNGTGLDQGSSPIKILGVKTNSYEVTGLSPNETYQFALKAYIETAEGPDIESGFSDNVPIPPASFPSPTIKIMNQN